MKLLLLFFLTITSKGFAQESIAIIVNKDNPANSLTRSEISDYFFKNIKHWPNGTAIRFIDRQPGSEEKKKFLRQIIRRSSSEVDMFWIGQKLYTGASSPLQVSNDQMMASVVSSFSGAIGYVSEGYPISGKIKKVEVTQ